MNDPRNGLHTLCLLGATILACNESSAPGGTEPVSTGFMSETVTTLETPTTGSGGAGPTTTTGETTSSTGETLDSSDTDPLTTTGLSGCGDGVVDADEQCDDGLAGNDDTQFCTDNCTLNLCGDGKLFVGWELCDEGEANSDAYGSLCGEQCEPGARCGDHQLQPEYETCDLGPNNGEDEGDEQGILCDLNCQALRLRAFITEDAFTGAMGGLFGADLKCRAAAEAAGLAQPERFHAYLSTGDVDASERFEEVAASRPYVLVTGKKIADDFLTLIEAGPLGEGISITEKATTIYMKSVATNTAPGGLSYSPDQHCQGWTSADPAYEARTGLNGLPLDSPNAEAWKDQQWWTGAESWHCNKAIFHLYCLEL
jgi:hypothetical protein